MTVKQWAEQQTGIVLKIPQGTITGHDHWYRYPLDHPEHPGEWSTSNEAWRVKIAAEMRPRVTQHDQYVELTIHAGPLEHMAHKAASNRSGRSVDGPLILKRRRSK